MSKVRGTEQVLTDSRDAGRIREGRGKPDHGGHTS